MSICIQSDEAAQHPTPPGSPGRGNAGTEGNPSKYEMVEARHFNSLEFKANSVAKYSPFHILDGEAYWYQHAPSAAQKHIPALISCKIQVGSVHFSVCSKENNTQHTQKTHECPDLCSDNRVCSDDVQPDTTCFIELERLKGPTLCHLYTNCCMTPNTLRDHFIGALSFIRLHYLFPSALCSADLTADCVACLLFLPSYQTSCSAGWYPRVYR